jgi:CRP/FNR family transcriptional regulator
MDLNNFLSNIFLFSSFTKEEISLLKQYLSTKKFRKGEQVFSEGMDANAFFIVMSGKVKIYKVSPDGKEHILHIQATGDLVAEAAIFDSKLYPASCMAIDESMLIRISREGFLHIIRSRPDLSLKMMSGYSRRLRQFVAKIEELSLKDIKTRLATYILENSSVEKGVTVCHLRYSKKELSALLGTIPETLSRALAYLKQKKFIIEKDSTIIVRDPEKLRIFSE